MAQAQIDPFAKYRQYQVSEPKEDPLAKYEQFRTDRPIETIIEEPETEPEIIEDVNKPVVIDRPFLWDIATTSFLPEYRESSKFNPEDKMVLSGYAKPFPEEPGDYWSGFAKGLDEYLYETMVRPIGSPLGAGLVAFGGPITRGALKVVSKLPVAAKVGELLTRDIFGKTAPKAIEAVAEAIPEATALPNVKVNPVEGGLTTASSVEKMPGGPNVGMYGITSSQPMFPTVPTRMQAPSTTQTVFDALLPSRTKEQIGQVVKLGEPEVPVVPKPVIAGVTSPNTNIVKPVETSVIAKLHKALEESKPLTEKQAEIISAERSSRIGKSRTVDIVDEESAAKAKAQLGGEHTKVAREALQLDQEDVNSLYKMIGDADKSNVVDRYEAIRAGDALKKLLTGSVPQPNEIATLEKIFGEGIAARIKKGLTGRELTLRTVSFPKSVVSAIDIGFPFRQGINHVGQREWFNMLRPAVEGWLSEAKAGQWLDAIAKSRLYDLKKRSGLAMYDLRSTDIDEFILNKGAEKLIPGVRRSNRANIVGSAKLRSDLFETMYDDYKRIYESQLKLAGDDKDLIRSAELLNPDNLYRARKMADLINTSTGRGNLSRLEPIAEELNAVLFSPRLMSSRIRSINRILNPMSYVNGDPVSRKYALKQLISITGTALSSAALLKSAGAEVELDPRSSDFLKGRIGNTRFDFGGGYLQYIVPTAQIMSSFGQMAGLPIDYSAKSTTSGEGYNLGENPIARDRWEVAENFLTNKASPIGSLFVALMKGYEVGGKPIDLSSISPFENTIMKTFMPFMIQDFKELMEEDPNLLPLLIGGAMGGNIQVHQQRDAGSFRR